MARPLIRHRTLLLVIIGCALVVVLRLAVTASETGNWWGAAVSSLHTLIVAVGAYLALRIASDGART